MAAHDKGRWHPPLKAPAVEIVDLLSDSDSTDTPLRTSEHNTKLDAYSTISRAQKTADDDAQWHAPLQASTIEFDHSFSRDISKEVSEGLANDDDAKARDASSEGSDGDEDSQWSLYEDALGGDEDEDSLHSSTNTSVLHNRLHC